MQFSGIEKRTTFRSAKKGKVIVIPKQGPVGLVNSECTGYVSSAVGLKKAVIHSPNGAKV